MMHLLLQTTQPVPSQLASDIVYVVVGTLGAVGAFVGVVLGAMAYYRSGKAIDKGNAALTTATVSERMATTNSDRIGRVAAHVSRVDGQQTDLAKDVGKVIGKEQNQGQNGSTGG